MASADGGWRKASDWRSRLKSPERAVSQAFRTRGAAREKRVAFAAQRYTTLAKALEATVAAMHPALKDLFAEARMAEK